MDFDDAMQVTSGVGEEFVFTPGECAGFWGLLQEIPSGGVALEIGCHRGRSSSLMLQAARSREFSTIHCDPWTTGEAVEWMAMAHSLGQPFTVLKMKSEEALALTWLAGLRLDLVFIDGDHDTPAVELDTQWGERVRPGGILCAHDYGRDWLSGVQTTLDQYTQDGRWEKLGQWETLAAWRRIG